MAARLPDLRQLRGVFAGWRGLRRFWAGVALTLLIAAGVLEALGPPSGASLGPPGGPPTATAVQTIKPVVQAEPVPAENQPGKMKKLPPPRLASEPMRPGRSTPGPIAGPDPALLEPYGNGTNLKLPRISPDGRAPMAAYAAGFDPSSVRPRVGILIAGIGMSEADSLAAIKDLPGAVTLAISPYASHLGHLLAIARMTEHEYLLAIPNEPQGYPVNDPDDRHALMTSLPPAENIERLLWVLSRITGYVGVTTAFGQMHGERLASVPDQLDEVLQEVARRGLLFVDGRTAQPVLPYAWNRSADIVVDADPTNTATLDQRLDALTRLALERGSALGIVSVPRPVTLARVGAWTNTLAAKGLALAPVSALVLSPAKQEAEK